MAITYDNLQPEYATLWDSLAISDRLRETIDRQAKRIIANRERYEPVSAATGVPWFVIGLIHTMEAGGSFSCHLHNGDPLSRRTVQVPKNRPASGNGPFTWEESATDAIRYDKLDRVTDWPVERIAFCLESFNGWGYRRQHADVLSPYLWSGTNHYVRGKYVADGKWSSTAVSAQAGAMAILKRLAELDTTIVIERASGAPEAEVEETTSDSFRKADKGAIPPVVIETAKRSRTIQAVLLSALGALVSAFNEVIAVALDASAKVSEWSSITGTYGMIKGLGLALVIGGTVWAIQRRLSDAANGRS